MKKLVAEEKGHEMDADGFLKLVRRYTDIEEMTLEILKTFVDKIVVHHREVLFGETVQKVEIYYRFIGLIELPNMSDDEKEQLIRSFGRKKEGAA